jgi:hypothetical protein
MFIFRGLSAVTLTDGEIVIGGDEDGTIPIPEFDRLLTSFPTTTEWTAMVKPRLLTFSATRAGASGGAARRWSRRTARRVI